MQHPTTISNPNPTLSQHGELLLRKPEMNKAALKEKFVAIYEAFFLVNCWHTFRLVWLIIRVTILLFTILISGMNYFYWKSTESILTVWYYLQPKSNYSTSRFILLRFDWVLIYRREILLWSFQHVVNTLKEIMKSDLWKLLRFGEIN